jgi:predicted dehydrogenase
LHTIVHTENLDGGTTRNEAKKGATGMVDLLIVGLGFGAHFIPVWMSHPDVNRVALVDRDPNRLAEETWRYGLTESFTSLDEALASDGYDAVHLVTPPTMHAEQSIAVLESGRHCAVAVPMGMSLEDLDRVIAAAEVSERNYMMLETAVYQSEYFYAEGLRDAGELGDITFLSGAHLRDRNGMPSYWKGFPPLKYATHAISPLLSIGGFRATTVHALGSGHLGPGEHGTHSNPYPIETAIFSLADTDVAMQVTQASFQLARDGYEGSSVYGSRRSVEWPQHGDALRVHHMPVEDAPSSERHFRPVDVQEVVAPLQTRNLPDPLADLLLNDTYAPANGGTFALGRPHSGSHPHLIHEFIASIVEGRRSVIDERRAAEWCAPGIVAHESALQGGAPLDIPNYRTVNSNFAPIPEQLGAAQ